MNKKYIISELFYNWIEIIKTWKNSPNYNFQGSILKLKNVNI